MPTPMPVPTPEPKYDEKDAEVNPASTRHPTGEIQAVLSDHKKAKKRRPLVNGILGLILTGATGSGGYGLYKSNTADASSEATRDRSVRTEERLTNHIEVEAESRKELKRQVRRLDRGQTTMSRKIDKQSMQNEIIMDALKVPKAKRPGAVEEEPADAEESEAP